MKTKIKLLKRIHYGQERLYPDCDLSRAICAISGKKTLNEEAQQALVRIGRCEIEIQAMKKELKS